MKHGIISDIHANPTALAAVLADGEKEGVGRWVCCGDATGYGYDAPSCVDMLRKRVDVNLMGNHDSACVGLEPPEVMMLCSNYDIDRQQRDQLSDAAKDWLKSRPYVWAAEDGSFACAHGEFTQPRAFDYMESVLVAHQSFASRPEPLLFVGHTHHAEYFAMNPAGKVSQKLAASFHMRPGWRYLVNVGSVGYPRVDMVTTYFIYDDVRRRVIYRELPFDFKRYILDMIDRDVALPEWLLRILLAAR